MHRTLSGIENRTFAYPMKIVDKVYFQESYVVLFFLKGYIIHIFLAMWYVLLDIEEDFL